MRRKPVRGDYYIGENICRGATTARYLQDKDFADPVSRLFFQGGSVKTRRGEDKLSLIDVIPTDAPVMKVPPKMTFLDPFPEVHPATLAIYTDGS